MIQLFVNGQTLQIAQPVIAANSRDYLELQLHCQTAEWAQTEKVVTFERSGADPYQIMLENDRITRDMHLNLSEGLWQVSVMGWTGNTRITTVPVQLTVKPSGALDGSTPPEIPPTVAEQILLKATEAERIAADVRQDLPEEGQPGYVLTRTADGGNAFMPPQGGGGGGGTGIPGPQGPKGEPGPMGPVGPHGPAGKDAPQIDDTQAVSTNPWSGEKTKAYIDTMLGGISTLVGGGF